MGRNGFCDSALGNGQRRRCPQPHHNASQLLDGGRIVTLITSPTFRQMFFMIHSSTRNYLCGVILSFKYIFYVASSDNDNALEGSCVRVSFASVLYRQASKCRE